MIDWIVLTFKQINEFYKLIETFWSCFLLILGPSEKLSYHNSFGQSFTGEGTRGAEGVIISSLMGALVRRLVRCRRELATQENISLFTEVRHLLTYLKSVHGNTFRRALLCALLCPTRTIVLKNKPSVPHLRQRM